MSKPPLHAIAADHVFDGTAVRERTAVIVDGTRIADLVPTADLPRTISTSRPARGRMAGPRLHRSAGQRRRRCSVQRSADRARHSLHRGGPSKIRHDGPAADAHNRQPGQDETCVGRVRPRDRSGAKRARASPRGAFSVARKARRARPAPHQAAVPGRPRNPDCAAQGSSAGHLGAGTGAAGFHRTAGGGRHPRVARAFDGILPADPRRHGGRAHGFHASVQCHAAVDEPGTAAPSRRRWNRPLPGSASSWTVMHVDPAMLRLALRGAGHPLLVTDAMPPVGGSRSTFTLHGETVTVRDGRCVTNDGTLAGADLDMATAVRNCVRLLGHPCRTRCDSHQPTRRRSSVSGKCSAGSPRDIAPISWPSIRTI